MDYADLKDAVQSDSHRTDTDTIGQIPRFIRLAEGLMARRLRSSEQDATVTLDDSDRSGVDSGIYTLPVGMLQVRRIVYGDTELRPVAINAIRRRGGSQSPYYYAVLGNRIEVRGIPPADAELVFDFFGRLEALSLDADTNVILTNHEALYLHGALHYLYRHTQDLELADSELNMFDNVLDALNEEAARKLGNAGSAPAYDFGGGGGY